MVAKDAVKMKRLLVAVLIGCLSGTGYAVPAVVDYVVDGDTFSAHVSVAGDVRVPIHVRLINVDTPELSGACAEEIKMARNARGRLEKLLPRGATVELDNVKDDKYLGRIDANVVLDDGRDVGNVLVQEGLARRYDGGRRRPWCKK